MVTFIEGLENNLIKDTRSKKDDHSHGNRASVSFHETTVASLHLDRIYGVE
jgi:hypothetical protein